MIKLRQHNGCVTGDSLKWTAKKKKSLSDGSVWPYVTLPFYLKNQDTLCLNSAQNGGVRAKEKGAGGKIGLSQIFSARRRGKDEERRESLCSRDGPCCPSSTKIWECCLTMSEIPNKFRGKNRKGWTERVWVTMKLQQLNRHGYHRCLVCVCVF